jgi:hypothetical protein
MKYGCGLRIAGVEEVQPPPGKGLAKAWRLQLQHSDEGMPPWEAQIWESHSGRRFLVPWSLVGSDEFAHALAYVGCNILAERGPGDAQQTWDHYVPMLLLLFELPHLGSGLRSRRPNSTKLFPEGSTARQTLEALTRSCANPDAEETDSVLTPQFVAGSPFAVRLADELARGAKRREVSDDELQQAIVCSLLRFPLQSSTPVLGPDCPAEALYDRVFRDLSGFLMDNPQIERETEFGRVVSHSYEKFFPPRERWSREDRRQVVFSLVSSSLKRSGEAYEAGACLLRNKLLEEGHLRESDDKTFRYVHWRNPDLGGYPPMFLYCLSRKPRKFGAGSEENRQTSLFPGLELVFRASGVLLGVKAERHVIYHMLTAYTHLHEAVLADEREKKSGARDPDKQRVPVSHAANRECGDDAEYRALLELVGKVVSSFGPDQRVLLEQVVEHLREGHRPGWKTLSAAIGRPRENLRKSWERTLRDKLYVACCRELERDEELSEKDVEQQQRRLRHFLRFPR